MPFTRSEQDAVTRVRLSLDGIPAVGGRALVPTGPQGSRADAFVPNEIAGYLNGLMARDQAAVWGMDPRDWTRELDKPRVDARWSRMALSYMQACSLARRPLDVRHYWAYLWAMYDAGLVSSGPLLRVPQKMPVLMPPAGTLWPAAEGFRDAVPIELAQRDRTQEQATAYAAAIGRGVALADSRSWDSLRADVATLGQEAVNRGITGRPSEASPLWLFQHGVTPAQLTEVANLANLMLYPYAEAGFSTPAHGWHVACALNDGTPVHTAAQTAFILAGYVDPDFVSPVPTAPWEPGAPTTPPPTLPGTGNGPVIGEAPTIDTPEGEGLPPPSTGGTGTDKPGDESAPTKPTDPLDRAPVGTSPVHPAVWIALGLGALSLLRR